MLVKGCVMFTRRIALLAALAATLALVGCSAGNAAPSHLVSHSSPRSPAVSIPNVDNVIGLKYSEAYKDLEGEGYTVVLDTPSDDVENYQEYFVVKGQHPVATKARPGTTITLHVEQIPLAAPNVVGQTYSQAQATIEAADGKLVAAGAGQPEPDWIVSAQDPPAGAAVKVGATITLTAPAPQVVMTITGNGSHSNVITYTIPGTFNIEQASDAPLPWTMSFPYTGEGLTAHGNISAQDDNGTSISCSISVAGSVVDQETATGQYAIVECGG